MKMDEHAYLIVPKASAVPLDNGLVQIDTGMTYKELIENLIKSSCIDGTVAIVKKEAEE